MGLLDGDLAQSIFEGFKDRLLTGVVRRKRPATSGGLNDHGDPVDLDHDEWEVQGFFDLYSRDTRARAGIPDEAVKTCIFAQSAPDWTPKQDDLVRLGTKWARLTAGPLEIDPAGALWTLQSQQIEAPS